MLSGLNEPITIYFDSYQIPQIYASNSEDLFFAQGYMHASARWWQMEWYRHSGHGRLSELVGSAAVPEDTLMHTLGIPEYAERDAARVSGESARLLDAYIRGVNGWIEDKLPTELAPEYALIDYPAETVQPWQREDSMVLQSLQALSFNETSLLAEVVSGVVMEEVGALFIDTILPPYPYSTYPVTMDPGGTVSNAQINPDTPLEAFSAIPAIDPIYMDITGSNAWVVSGELSQTGMPLLANDTHMGVRMPSYWYQVGLHCVELTPDCPYDVSGATIPGSPGVIIGHNQNVAWGFTNAQTDMIDLFQLQINPTQSNQYLYNNDYVDMQVESIQLEVAGMEPLDVVVRSTIFGPVIEQFDGLDLPHAYALRWAVADGNRAIEAIFAANRATDWESFQTAFELFDAPGLNVLYADTAGNIGYLLSGRVPIRTEGHTGMRPVMGIDDAHRWQGYVEPRQLPRLFNPEEGYIFSANNAMIDAAVFPHPIAYFYDYGFRAARLETLLEEIGEHSIATFEAMQLDTHHPAADVILPAISTIQFENQALNTLVTWLQSWDYQNEVDSAEAALFNVFLANVMVYGLDELPIYEASHSIYLLSLIMQNPSHFLWINTDLNLVNRDEVLARAFYDAYTLLVDQFGSNYENWRWGDLHQVHFEPNILDYVTVESDVADSMTARIAVPGTLATVNVSNFNPASGTFNATSLASIRMLLDVQDFDRSRVVNSTSQTGDYRQPNYADVVPLWASGAYLDHVYSRAAVEQSAEETWLLVPEDN